MTPDKAMELARRWYMCQGSCGGETIPALTDFELSALINQCIKEERDACAKLCTDPLDYERIVERNRA